MMNKHLLAVATLALCAAHTALAQSTGVQRLAWLQGCWAMTQGERSVEEQWTAPRAGSMLGLSRTLRGDKLVEHEFVIVRERGDQLAYEVSPSGRPPTVFLSTVIGDTSVVFENLQHDFPQRVAYERQGANLLAWIEGPSKGQTRRVEYPYRRVACAAD